MHTGRTEKRFKEEFGKVGIEVNGTRDFDIQVRNPDLYTRIAKEGLEGLNDSYVDGWWDCDRIDVLSERAIGGDLPKIFANHPRVWKKFLKEKMFNLQTRRHSKADIHKHYDLPPELFMSFLGETRQYSCAYWDGLNRKDHGDLDKAQRQKMELIALKARLEPEMRVLDIGCGWGGLARHFATRHGVDVVGITLSEEQANSARNFCEDLGDKIEIRIQDYRDVKDKFDRIVSVGMVEHVGQKNYGDYFGSALKALKDKDGLFVLHGFTSRESFPNRERSEVNWFSRRNGIFPGMVIPSPKQLAGAFEKRFVIEDVHNFGVDYDPTLMAWDHNFRENWDKLKESSELFAQWPEEKQNRFYRRWHHYLTFCAGAFRARRYQLHQYVLSPEGVSGGYKAPREIPRSYGQHSKVASEVEV
ncbi:MAG: cyclopropane fatty acyl phospholipid synthase [Nanoarchaeota archaeon]